MSYIEDLNAITTPSLTDLLYIYQNGADFKITNQQLLDLIKTNTVIPITQSDYDDLTPAEKNNGSIYIITDASITADDVEYSSGVSVKDKLDDLTTPVISSVTWNDTNVTGDPTRKSVITLGKLVIFSIEFTPLNGKIAHNSIIATGLPIPNNGVGSASARFVYSDRGRQFAVDDSGNLLWYFPGVTSDYSRIDITGVYVK